VTVCPGNAGSDRPLVHALVLLVDPETGVPEAVLDGTWLTALRTGAASGLATELLARTDASVLAVVGAGVQARTQIEAVRAVRPIREIRVRSRRGASAARLVDEVRRGVAEAGHDVEVTAVDDPEAHLAGAHVVVTATDASEAVIPDAVAPGTHVNAVGAYTPRMRELPGSLMGRATLFVDQRAAARAEAGDLIRAIDEGHLTDEVRPAELGEVVAGLHPGRTAEGEITVFKSVGSAAQDLAVARLAVDRPEGGGATG
jgi:ornithine cyclodeaminase